MSVSQDPPASRFLQAYQKEGEAQNVDPILLANSVAAITAIHDYNSHLPALLSLKHLSLEAGVDYPYLRKIVSRAKVDNYHSFRLKKNSKNRGYRTIVVPSEELMQTQRWILRTILCHMKPHQASYAYEKGKTIADAAALHCGAQWMIKLDVQRFFESFSEVAVYRIFVEMGYQPLLAFELSRICTRIGKKSTFNEGKQWKVYPPKRKRRQKKIKKNKRKRRAFIVNHWGEFYCARSYKTKIKKYTIIPSYSYHRLGHLPQGAPTSPMLANLIMRKLDKRVSKIAQEHGLIYSRYSDDLTLSSVDKAFGRENSQAIIAKIYAIMGHYGLSPNKTKTKIIPVGSRKMVLGLLVDGKQPRLNKKFRDTLRMHLHYLTKEGFGPAAHAKNRHFASVEGLKNHVRGLIAYAADVDPDYAQRYQKLFNEVDWPLSQ